MPQGLVGLGDRLDHRHDVGGKVGRIWVRIRCQVVLCSLPTASGDISSGCAWRWSRKASTAGSLRLVTMAFEQL
jgi:hypothetical protein